MRNKKPFFSSYLQMTVKQVDKRTAKKLFEEGRTIYLKSSNMMFDSFWQSPCPINKEKSYSDNFDELASSFKYYNCCWETGYYVNYFVEVYTTI